jgi:hypothetical protein
MVWAAVDGNYQKVNECDSPSVRHMDQCDIQDAQDEKDDE